MKSYAIIRLSFYGARITKWRCPSVQFGATGQECGSCRNFKFAKFGGKISLARVTACHPRNRALLSKVTLKFLISDAQFNIWMALPL